MKLMIAILALALAGCAHGPSVISDASADSVKIQQNINTPDYAVRPKADEACGYFNKKAIGPVSFKCLDGYCLTKVHLFICKAP